MNPAPPAPVTASRQYESRMVALCGEASSIEDNFHAARPNAYRLVSVREDGMATYEAGEDSISTLDNLARALVSAPRTPAPAAPYRGLTEADVDALVGFRL